MSKHKSEDYKLSTVKYYLVSDENKTNVCKKKHRNVRKRIQKFIKIK
jgi:hypothetical protein